MKSLFILTILLLASSCASNRYINKDHCIELGGPVLECQAKAIIR